MIQYSLFIIYLGLLHFATAPFAGMRPLTMRSVVRRSAQASL